MDRSPRFREISCFFIRAWCFVNSPKKEIRENVFVPRKKTDQVTMVWASLYITGICIFHIQEIYSVE